MPLTAEFIDQLRDAFGKSSIDSQIRKGLSGQPTFWASENGVEIGTKPDFIDVLGPSGSVRRE